MNKYSDFEVGFSLGVLVGVLGVYGLWYVISI